jgi:hypothetical protein
MSTMSGVDKLLIRWARGAGGRICHRKVMMGNVYQGRAGEGAGTVGGPGDLQVTMLRRHAAMDHCSMEALVLVFSIIFKVFLSNQIQETGRSVDIPRLLSAFAFLLLDTDRKGRIF